MINKNTLRIGIICKFLDASGALHVLAFDSRWLVSFEAIQNVMHDCVCSLIIRLKVINSAQCTSPCIWRLIERVGTTRPTIVSNNYITCYLVYKSHDDMQQKLAVKMRSTKHSDRKMLPNTIWSVSLIWFYYSRIIPPFLNILYQIVAMWDAFFHMSGYALEIII